MGLPRVSILVGIIVLIFGILYSWEYLFEEGDSPPNTIEEKYFGSSLPIPTDAEDSAIIPFKVPFDRSQVEDVLHRLRNTRVPPSYIIVDNQKVNQSTYGFSEKTAKSVREYWINTFDWKKTVEELNTFNHYKTRISGLDIHFVRMSSNNDPKEAILFVHGWPGSFLEYLNVARTLISSSASSSYDLIIPSLPGFGYSDASVRSGLDTPQIARILNVLMQRLGHQSYVVCGGDWGAEIGTRLVQFYPKHVRGFLTTMIFPVNTLSAITHSLLAHYVSPSLLLEKDEREYLRKPYDAFRFLKFFGYEGGYFHIQATKPDTVAYALTDSPLGLATYILDLWFRWSNYQNDIDRSSHSDLDFLTLDELLSNVMLYWTTGTIASSMRIYHEYLTMMSTKEGRRIADGRVSKSVPVAVMNYPYEGTYVPRAITRRRFPNIKLWLFHDQGGHFAAAERPRQYARDLETFLLQLKRQS